MPVFDPSKNVDALVEAAIKRQDDLRNSDSAHIRELMEVRAEYDQRLREAGGVQAEIRSRYEDRLREKETQRLDAIRAVDVATGAAAAQAAEARATTLAAAQQASAEVLRNQLEQARITTADALEARIAPLVKAVEDLRQAQYQQQGERSSKVETSTTDRDAVNLRIAEIQASQARMQMIALVFSAVVIAIALYAALHK
jgi:hypothetical protein